MTPITTGGVAGGIPAAPTQKISSDQQIYDGAKKRYKYRTVKASSAREANKLLTAFVAEFDEGRAPDAPTRLTVDGGRRRVD